MVAVPSYGWRTMSTRAATPDDLDAIADIYAHYVATSVATFELVAPSPDEWRRRFAAIVDAGLPFLVAERDGVIAGYAYCGPWKTRPAYRATVEDSVYVAPSHIGRGCGTELLRDLLDAYVGELLGTPRRQAERLAELLPKEPHRDGAA